MPSPCSRSNSSISWTPTPSQTSKPPESSRQGLFSLSLLPGGIGTRFHAVRSLAASRSVQPAGSVSRALLLSLGSPAAAAMKATPLSSPASRQQRIGLPSVLHPGVARSPRHCTAHRVYGKEGLAPVARTPSETRGGVV